MNAWIDNVCMYLTTPTIVNEFIGVYFKPVSIPYCQVEPRRNKSLGHEAAYPPESPTGVRLGEWAVLPVTNLDDVDTQHHC